MAKKYRLPSGQIISEQDTNIKEYKNQGAVLIPEETSEVGMLSADKAISVINNSKEYLDIVTAPRETSEQSKQYDIDLAKETKEKETKEEEGGYTLEEMIELVGNDFSGVIKKGNLYYPDESALVRAGLTGLTTEDTGQELRAEVDEATQQLTDLRNEFLSYDVNTDPDYTEAANAIQGQYDKLIREMERTNKSRQRALETLGYRSGATQYAGGVQMGIEGEEARQAGNRIAELENQAALATMQAKMAFENNEYSKFSQKIGELKDAREEKMKALENYNEKLIAIEKKMREKNEFNLKILETQANIDAKYMTDDTKEYNLAKQEGFEGSFMDYLVVTENLKQQTTNLPTSYKEWELAGGIETTGMQYHEWLSRKEQETNELDKILTPTEAEKLGVPYGTTKREAFGIKIQGGELTSKQLGSAIQLSNSLKSHPMYTDMLDIATGIQGVRTGLAQGNGFGDITAINAFQRMVDPGATVRSEDVTLLQSASSIIQRILSDYPIEKLKEGDKLPSAVRDQMLRTAEELYERRAGNYNESVGKQYKNLAEGAGVPFEMVGQDFMSMDQIINQEQQPRSLEDYYIQNPGEQAKVEQMIVDNPDLNEDEILQIITGENTSENNFNW